MQKQQKTIFFGVLGVLIVGLVVLAIFQNKNSSTSQAESQKYDGFAMCLKDKGAVFYGAFWCPHCQAQKKLFGKSAKLLPYVECSTPDGNDSTQLCKDKKVEAYPTWELADGTRIPVENAAGVTLETLSEKTGCVLPTE